MKRKLHLQQRKGWFLVLSILIIGILALYSSCTALGALIGSRTERLTKKQVFGIWEYEKIKVNSNVECIMKNGTLIKGKYIGTSLMQDEDSYRRIYDSARLELKKRNVELPALGDSIDFISEDSNQMQMITRKRYGGFSKKGILLYTDNTEVLYSLPFFGNQILYREVRFDSGKLKLVLRPDERKMLPNRDEHKQIMISGAGFRHVTYIEASDIDSVKYFKRGNYAVTGALVGLSVDLVIASVIVYTAIAGFSSLILLLFLSFCPFVYSFDGKDFHLDSETFGGAICRGLQREDYDRLEHLQQCDGKYILKVRNELKETEYLDELKLYIIDHPEGTEIISDGGGKISLISHAVKPLSAKNQYGRDILQLVSKKDTNFWRSNPFNRNIERKEELRDELIVHFRKPKGSKSGILLARLQNSLWSSYMQSHLLALHGHNLNQWYSLLDTSKVMRDSFVRVMKRERMLLIQERTAQGWKDKDWFWEVGPFIPEESAVRLEFTEPDSEEVVLRLSSTPGFWNIDYVSLDCADNGDFKVQILEPKVAKQSACGDILPELQKIDANYAVLPEGKNYIDLEFPAVAIDKGKVRSYILKSSGYYQIHVDTTGNPQYRLIEEFMKQPGAYSKYTLQLLKDQWNQFAYGK